MRRHRAAAVALAALLVAAPLAVPVGPTFAAIPLADGDATAVPPGTPLDSGAEYWQGTRLVFNGSRIVEDPGSAPVRNRTFGVWRVTGDGLGDRLVTFTIDETGYGTIDTARFSGRVVVRYKGDPVYVRNGTGYLSAPPGGPNVTVESGAFRVEKQTLSAAWSEDTVYDGEFSRLVLGSNREEYDVAVTSDDLSTDAIARLFETAGVDVRREDGRVLLDAGTETRIPVNTTGIGAGEYFLEFSVPDTTASSAALLTVEEPGSVRIASLERAEHAGDFIEVTVRCRACSLFVGGPGDGLFDVVWLEDANGDRRVSVRINTRYMGLTGGSGVPSSVNVYNASPDRATRLPPNKNLSPPDLDASYSVGKVRRSLGLDASGRSTPLGPGATFDVTVSETNYTLISTGFEIVDERHAGTGRLTDRSLGGLGSLAIPGDRPGPLTAADIRAAGTRRDRIAVGDRLVLRVDVSGVFGNVVGRYGGGVGAVLDNGAEGIDLTVRRHRYDALDLAPHSRLVVDRETDRLYLVVRTGDLGLEPPRDGETFEATFSLSGDDYPYLPAGTEERATTDVTFVPANVTIESVSTAGGRITVAGNTTFVPGSTLTVLVAADEPYTWTTATGVTVGEGGQWSATVDASTAPGRNFSVRVLDAGQVMDEVERITVTDTTPTATPTPSPSPTPTATPTPSPTATPTRSPLPRTTRSPTPTRSTATVETTTTGRTTTSATTAVPTTSVTAGTTTAPPTTGGTATTATTAATATVGTTATATTAATTAGGTATTATTAITANTTAGATTPGANGTTRTTTAGGPTTAPPTPPGSPPESSGGIAFAPDLPRLPPPFDLVAIVGALGSLGGVVALALRP